MKLDLEVMKRQAEVYSGLPEKGAPEADALASARAAAISEFRNIVNPNYKLNDGSDLGKKQRERLNAALDQMDTLPPSVVCVPVETLEQVTRGVRENWAEDTSPVVRGHWIDALAALTKVTRR